MISTIIGKKLGQTQGFLEDGKRIPMTKIDVSSLVVSQVKTEDREGYNAIQLGFGMNPKADKPTKGHATKAGLTTVPRFFRESKVDKIEDIEVGALVNPAEVLSAGDLVDVSGISKGKGYAGVVKRHHFKGGPKTHGQSDRHRAPGSIGQSTTPGRVYKGKRMAGRMGVEHVTVKNLEVIDLADGVLLVKGLVPGPISSIVTITRRGENKKHQGLYKEPVAEEVAIDEAVVEEIGPSVEEQEAMRKEAEAKADEQEKAEQAAAQVANQEDVNTATESKSVTDVKEEASDASELPEAEEKNSIAEEMANAVADAGEAEKDKEEESK